jgi:hypothetical protein
LIDTEFEARLVDRIAARELIARRLTPRQRRLLCRTVRYGDTLAEAGAAERMSGTRAGQIVAKAMGLLCDERARAAIQPERRGFDKAAFLRHMQRLIEARDRRNAEAFATERAVLDRLLEDEAAKAAPPPKPATVPVVKPIKSPGWHVAWHAVTPKQTPVEPWFGPEPPTEYGLKQIALYALQYLSAVCRPQEHGLQKIGSRCAALICGRNADAIAGELKRFADSLPHNVRFSVRLPPPIEPSATASSYYIALRVASVMEHCMVSIFLSWDA